MRKFKTGDKIVRVCGEHSAAPLGFTATVTKHYRYVDNDYVLVDIIDGYWELAEDTSKRHVHYDLIIAWAKGAKIQFYCKLSEKWINSAANNPSWTLTTEYRVEPPKPKTDAELIIELRARIDELEGEYGP